MVRGSARPAHDTAQPMNYENLLTWLFVAICIVVLCYLACVMHIIFRWF